ncbi:MAG: hypothetical protein ACRD5H_09530, partial [Nitrososphaerales archaeon]
MPEPLILPQGIYLEHKPALGPALQHLYLVYRDGLGGEFVIRGGPTNLAFPLSSPLLLMLANVPLQSTLDAYGPGESAFTRGFSLVSGGPGSFGIFQNMVSDVTVIQNAPPPYTG